MKIILQQYLGVFSQCRQTCNSHHHYQRQIHLSISCSFSLVASSLGVRIISTTMPTINSTNVLDSHLVTLFTPSFSVPNVSTTTTTTTTTNSTNSTHPSLVRSLHSLCLWVCVPPPPLPPPSTITMPAPLTHLLSESLPHLCVLFALFFFGCA